MTEMVADRACGLSWTKICVACLARACEANRSCAGCGGELRRIATVGRDYE